MLNLLRFSMILHHFQSRDAASVVGAANCKALSGSMFDQRFNVARTWGTDRMYSVRSVQMNALSDKDLRMSLLTHFESRW